MEIFLGTDQYMNYKFWSLKKVEIIDLKMHVENTTPISEREFSNRLFQLFFKDQNLKSQSYKDYAIS